MKQFLDDVTDDEGRGSLAIRTNAEATEIVRNGELIDWTYWVGKEPTRAQAARLAYGIDPIKWPESEYAQGSIPDVLRERIERFEQWLEQYWPFPNITLAQLVIRFGAHSLGTLREAAAPELAALEVEREREKANEQARRDAGRYYLEEIADELAKQTSIAFDRWLETIEKAVHGNQLSLRNPDNYADNLPFEVPKVVRIWLDQCHFEDVNRWLESHPEWGAARLGANERPKETKEERVSRLNTWKKEETKKGPGWQGRLAKREGISITRLKQLIDAPSASQNSWTVGITANRSKTSRR